MAYKQIPVSGPWGGIRDDVARPYAPLNAFDDVLNFFTQKGRIQTRPKLTAFGTAPDGKPVRLMQSFTDKNGYIHSLVLTTYNAYALATTTGVVNTNGTAVAWVSGTKFATGTGAAGVKITINTVEYTILSVTTDTALVLTGNAGTQNGVAYSVYWNNLTMPGGITDLGEQNRPFGNACINNRIYFSQGPTKVCYTDGSKALSLAGDVPGGARFMGVLASRLILAYTEESAVLYPRRIRWCRAGNPNNWTSFSSGSADLMEVPDEINGFAVSGNNGLIFRENGITAMLPTGVGTSPFAFSHFSVQPTGIGNKYPYSLAAYGNQHIIFVSADDIYRVRGLEVMPIGRAVKKKIFADLALANGTVTGQIIPNLGIGYDFLSYWLVIPKSGSTAVWVFQMDDETWVRFSSSAGVLGTIGSVYTT
jgi:hypothetical protein